MIKCELTDLVQSSIWETCTAGEVGRPIPLLGTLLARLEHAGSSSALSCAKSKYRLGVLGIPLRREWFKGDKGQEETPITYEPLALIKPERMKIQKKNLI